MAEATALVRQNKHPSVALALGTLAALSAAAFLQFELRWTIVFLVAMTLVWLAVVVDTRRLLLGLVIMAAPISISKTIIFHETHFGGAQVLDVTLLDVFLLAGFCHWLLSAKDARQPARKWGWPVGVTIGGLLFFSLLSLTRAVDLQLGLFEFWRTIKAVLLFVFIARRVDLDKDMTLIFTSLLAGVAIQASLAVSQFALGTSFGLTTTGESQQALLDTFGDIEFSRVGGSIGAPNALASYLVLLLPTAMALLLIHREWLTRFVVGGSALTAVAAVILTMSRAAWLGLGAAIIFIVAAAVIKRLIPWWAGLSVVALPVVTVLVVDLMIGNVVMARLFRSPEVNYSSRVELAAAAYDVIKANPILGIGLNNFAETVFVFDLPDIPSPTPVYAPVHNFYLLVASEIGIPGFLFLMGFFGLMIMMAAKGLDSDSALKMALALGLIGGFITILVQGIFDLVYRLDATFFSFWILSGLAVAVAWDAKTDLKEPA